jgi:hypothetical protein
MDDLDLTKSFFKSLGITGIKETTDPSGVVTLTIKAKCCDKVSGYNDFVTEFNFEKGKFIFMGAWE